MMLELAEGSCYPTALVVVNVVLSCIDGFIAVLAFYQLMRIHSRNSHIGWTRQKVFHLMIGSSNVGYFVYFVLTLIAACKGWVCWSQSCGFIVMACPKILFLAAFLLLLSFWVDLCHQSNDDDDEDEVGNPPREPLLYKMNKSCSHNDTRRKWRLFPIIHVGSHQKVVILVTALVFVLMITSAVLIWIGMGKNPINSSTVARVYVDLFAISMLLLGGALACYGIILFLKMRKVRSERASSEMRKVAGLAVVSVLCFTSSALVALFTDIPMPTMTLDVAVIVDALSLASTCSTFAHNLLLITMCSLIVSFGSSIPSAFVLWVMRELPPLSVGNMQEESRTIVFISDSSVTPHPQRWTTATSSQNQVSRASPI